MLHLGPLQRDVDCLCAGGRKLCFSLRDVGPRDQSSVVLILRECQRALVRIDALIEQHQVRIERSGWK